MGKKRRCREPESESEVEEEHEAESAPHVDLVAFCVSCSTNDPAAFSKRMLNKRGRHGDRVRRCRACVEAALAAEQREAERRRAAPEGSRERSIRGGAHLECASCLQRLPAAAFSAIELDADDGDATCLRCEGAPVGLYDGDVRGGENAFLAERQQKRRPPA